LISLPQSRWLLLLPVAAAGILFLVWCMRKLSLKAQFLVLLAMGVSISFVLLMIVQLPEYRSWLAILLVLIVFVASPIAVRIFLRSLTQEDNEQTDEARKHKS
jgi:FtsH-binding integral membrane protein